MSKIHLIDNDSSHMSLYWTHLTGTDSGSVFSLWGRNRSDWCVVDNWSYPDLSSVNAKKTISANDNFASEDYALAA